MSLRRHQLSKALYTGSEFKRPSIPASLPSGYVHWPFDAAAGDRFLDSTGKYSFQLKSLSTKNNASIPVTIGRYIDIRAKFPKAYTHGQFDELYIVEGALTPRQIVQLRDHNILD